MRFPNDFNTARYLHSLPGTMATQTAPILLNSAELARFTTIVVARLQTLAVDGTDPKLALTKCRDELVTILGVTLCQARDMVRVALANL